MRCPHCNILLPKPQENKELTRKQAKQKVVVVEMSRGLAILRRKPAERTFLAILRRSSRRIPKHLSRRELVCASGGKAFDRTGVSSPRLDRARNSFRGSPSFRLRRQDHERKSQCSVARRRSPPDPCPASAAAPPGRRSVQPPAHAKVIVALAAQSTMAMTKPSQPLPPTVWSAVESRRGSFASLS